MKKIIYIILYVVAISCSGLFPKKIQKDSRTIHNYKIEYFKVDRASRGIIVELDPISLPLQALEYNWHPYWLENNFEIVQISQQEKRLLQPEEISSLLEVIIQMYSSNNKPLILTGISLGGISILDWLNQEKKINTSITKIMIIGSGWDYSYSGNLFVEEKDILKHYIKNIHNHKFTAYKEELLKKYNTEIINNFYFPDILLNKKEVKFIPEQKIPILFIVGKIDNFAPEESLILFINNYKQCTFKPILSPCYYIEASRANFFDIDYNHFDLFLYNNVKEDLYDEIKEWILWEK